MSTQRQQPGTRHTGPMRQLAIATALLLCAGLGACTAIPWPAAAPTEGSAEVPALPNEAELDAGTYRVTTFAVPFEVTVPDGWRIVGGWRLIRATPGEEHSAFLTFLRSSYVPADACETSSPIPEVESTIEGFVDALVAQSSTTTTAPIEVMVSDYRALEFDLAVEGDVDIVDCRSEHVCVHSESPSCTRWYTSVTERETYRVVDLGSQRAVLSVGQYDDDVDDAVMQEARAVFDSIVFKPSE